MELPVLPQLKNDDDETSATNCVWSNDYTLIDNVYPKVKKSIEQTGHKTIELFMPKLRKLEGGLSFLHLRS